MLEDMHRPSLSTYTDRKRADSFGSAANAYDHYRPRYPRSLIAALVTKRQMRILDVGAGTGIASEQLSEAGANVVAVEPDPRMARLAAAKGLHVEQATFEEWQSGGRTFDLVVFAQSFHWVEPRGALDRVPQILSGGGRLVLLSNRIKPVKPDRDDLDKAYEGILDVTQRPSIDAARDKELGILFAEAGFSVREQRVIEQLHYPTEDWIEMVSTYSNVLTLQPDARAELRRRLEERIGAAGVDAENDAVAVICTYGG